MHSQSGASPNASTISNAAVLAFQPIGINRIYQSDGIVLRHLLHNFQRLVEISLIASTFAPYSKACANLPSAT
jgi:hypothetical protein